MPDALDFLDGEEWTVERLDAMLSEPGDIDLDWRRFEIVDGVLIVTPPPMPPHEAVLVRLSAALLPAAPPGVVVLAASRVGVRRSYLITDLTVVTSAGYRSRGASLTGEQVLLAVEIESPTSVARDRVLKPALYAEARIAHFWRIEADPLRFVTYQLVDGVYAETGSWGADETARITDPFPLEFAVGSLLPTV